jgi:serine/threonine protein kinase
VVAPAVPLAVVKPQTIICRICERHILSDKLAIHSTRCSVISAWHMQVDLGDESIKNIQRLLQSMMRQRSSSHCKAKMCVAAPKVSIEIEEDTTPVLPAAAVTPVEDQDQNAIDPHVAVVLQYARRLLELLQHAVNIQRQDGQAVKLLGEAQKAAQDILDEWTDAAMDAPEPAEVELVCTPEALYHSVDIAFKEKIMALQKLHDIVGHYYAPQQFDDAVETWMSMHHPLPSMEDFIVLKMISKGAFGSVFLVRHKRTDELMAVKVLRRSDSPKECAAFVKERNLMLLMDHPFLVRLFYSFASAENYYLAMEFLSGGDCFSLLQSIGFVDEGLAKVYVAELVLAIHHLHRRGVVHRDIKPDNILIGQDGHVRLTDFGLSRLELVDMSLGVCPYFTDEYTEQATKDQTPVLSARPWRRFSQVGTPDYLAPEILLKSAYGPCVDWWALGVVIFELLVGNTPFDDVSTDKIYDNILHGRVRWPNVPSEMSVAAKDLISGLLSLSPADRLGANGIESIQRHPFFAGVDWNSLNASHSKFLPDLDDPTDTRYFDGRNAVFYSDLEVSFSGSRLDQVHLGSGGEAAATAADQDEDEDAVFRRLPYMGKAFWNLHALNMRATGGARSNVMD